MSGKKKVFWASIIANHSKLIVRVEVQISFIGFLTLLAFHLSYLKYFFDAQLQKKKEGSSARGLDDG